MQTNLGACNYAQTYPLHFSREESRYAIANKSACSVIMDFVTPSTLVFFSAKAKYSGKQKLYYILYVW